MDRFFMKFLPAALVTGSFMMILWAIYLILAAEYVATLDIAASLMGAALVSLGLASIAYGMGRQSEAIAIWSNQNSMKGFNPSNMTPAPAHSRAGAFLQDEKISEQKTGSEDERSNQLQRIVREGTVGEMIYKLFADGSVETTGPQGTRQYASIDEMLKARRNEK